MCGTLNLYAGGPGTSPCLARGGSDVVRSESSDLVSAARFMGSAVNRLLAVVVKDNDPVQSARILSLCYLS